MKHFQDRDNRNGGFRGGDNRGQDRERRMYSATCSTCGKSCEVPFKPTNGKPVLCRECFNLERPEGDTRGGSRPDFNNRGPRRDFDRKPAFRSDNRDSRPAFTPSAPVANDDSKKYLMEISTKLDKLITVFEKMTTLKDVVNQATAPKTEKVVKEKKAKKKSK